MRRVTNTILSSESTYQSLNWAHPSRKSSIKVPAKCKTCIYVLTKICLQWSNHSQPIYEMFNVEIIIFFFNFVGQKPHECTECGKRFALGCNMKAHLKTHDPNRINNSKQIEFNEDEEEELLNVTDWPRIFDHEKKYHDFKHIMCNI